MFEVVEADEARSAVVFFPALLKALVGEFGTAFDSKPKADIEPKASEHVAMIKNYFVWGVRKDELISWLRTCNLRLEFASFLLVCLPARH